MKLYIFIILIIFSDHGKYIYNNIYNIGILVKYISGDAHFLKIE